MASVFDAIGPTSAGKTGGSPTPNTWTHTITGTNNTAVVFASLDNITHTTVTACSFGGASMTEIGRQVSGGSPNDVGFLVAFALAGVTAGANTVSFSWTDPGAVLVTGGSISASGSNGVGTAVLGSGNGGGGGTTSGTITVPSTTSGNLIAAGVAAGSDNVIFTAGTSRWETATSGGGAAGSNGGASIVSGGGNATISWTMAQDFYASIAVEFLAAGGAPPVAKPPVLITQEAVNRSSLW